MKQQFAAVRDHYQAAIVDAQAVLGQVAQQLEAIEGPLSAERTGNFDQFHVGGLAATAELARRVGVTAGMRVLDAGSGLRTSVRFRVLVDGHPFEIEFLDASVEAYAFSFG
jgi:sarcosine/dimethylglycine N-methyltransferase